jgi:hypothetical protein
MQRSEQRQTTPVESLSYHDHSPLSRLPTCGAAGAWPGGAEENQMRYCPTCKQAFGSDVKECPKHRTPLVDELPFQTIEGDDRTWVEITTASTIDEARIIQGFLEAEGLDCQIESLKFSMEPINFGSMGEIRVYVPADQEEKANALLQSRERQYDRIGDEESVVTDEGVATIDESMQNEVEGD